MTSLIKLGHTNLVPVNEAAKKVSYSRDYITKLARQGKIIALVINRQWMIDVDSLNTFFLLSEHEMKVRKNHLKEMRHYELKVRNFYSEKLQPWYTGYHQSRHVPTTKSSLIVLSGLFLGVLLNFSIQHNLPSRLATKAQIPVPVVSQLLAVVIGAEFSNSSATAGTTFSSADERTDRLPMNNGIVLFSQGLSTTSSEVGNLFSDNTIVEMTSSTTGFVYSPDFENGSGIPFVQIPAPASVAVSSQTKHELP